MRINSDEALPWLQALSSQLMDVVHGNGPISVACRHDLARSVARIVVTLPDAEVVGGAHDGEHRPTLMLFELAGFMKLLADPGISMTAAQCAGKLSVMTTITGKAYGFDVEIEIQLGAGAQRAFETIPVNPDGTPRKGAT